MNCPHTGKSSSITSPTITIGLHVYLRARLCLERAIKRLARVSSSVCITPPTFLSQEHFMSREQPRPSGIDRYKFTTSLSLGNSINRVREIATRYGWVMDFEVSFYS